MIDLPLDKLTYPELLKLGSRSKDKRVSTEILKRKSSERPKVRGFREHHKLSDTQQKILRLFSSGIVGEPEPTDTKNITMRFAKHTAKGGWVAWLTAADERDLSKTLKKISRLRVLVEEEKSLSGLCRIYIIPVKNKKDGWEGFKVRLDRGSRLVYEDV